MKRQLLRQLSAAALSICMVAGFSVGALAAVPEGIWDCTTSRNEDNDIVVDFRDVQVTLPSSWAGKCQINTSDDYAMFSHSASRKLYTEELGYPNGGHLFSICFSENYDFTDLPAYDLLGETEDGYYFIEYPTDYQGYANDEDVAAEFNDLSSDIVWIFNNIYLKNEIDGGQNGFVEDTEYILPDSSSAYLTESDLASLDADEIQMAINEIYARHHRKFTLKNVQDYFNEKSWYTGTVEPEDFDVSVMNEYEGANINLMLKCMNQKK